MGKLLNLVGKKFGRLTVIEQRGKDKHGEKLWYCKCDCTNYHMTTTSCLTSGKVKSCGCGKVIANKKRIVENKYIFKDDYGIGYDKNKREFYFDLEYYDKIKNYCWHVDKDTNYVFTTFNDKTIYMHRLILDLEEGDLYVDHINHKTNDNRKINMRKTTHQENLFNQKLKSNNTSGVTGVGWLSKYDKWRAYITLDYKFIELGTFYIFEDAVKARKEAEIKYFGEYNYTQSSKRNLEVL